MKKLHRSGYPWALIGLAAACSLLVGWERVEIKDIMVTQPKTAVQTMPLVLPETGCAVRPAITPYKVMAGASAAFFQLDSLQVDMELWLQNPLFHIKALFKEQIRHVDDSKTDGQINLSLVVPFGLSTSEWVQSYEIGGIPFTWDREKREWKQKELQITGKDAKSVLAYGLLRSLFSIDEDKVDPGSIRIRGTEPRRGKQCYVVTYTLDKRVFERWNMMGSLVFTSWVEQSTFLPQELRVEGKLGDMYMLQKVTYSNFNAGAALTPDAFISKQVSEAKSGLKSSVQSLSAEVAAIRGWNKIETIPVEFMDRVRLRGHLAEQMAMYFDPAQLENESLIYKWLGLLREEIDFKDALLTAEISSLAALYDPWEKKIIIGDWIHPALAEPVLVHEITHAYQDRNYSLAKFHYSKDVLSDLDMGLARHALTEGEATAVMLEYLLKQDSLSFKSLGDILAFVEEKILKDADSFKDNLMYNIYGYGANFIQFNLKNDTWQNLDALYQAPPESMAQILHPYKYYSQRKSRVQENQRKRAAEAMLPAEWARMFSTRIGEFLIMGALREELERPAAEAAAEGWADDRLDVLVNTSGQRVLVWQTVWNSPEDAEEFAAAFTQSIKKRFDAFSLEQKGTVGFIEAGGDQAYALSRLQDSVTVIWSKDLPREDFRALCQGVMGR